MRFYVGQPPRDLLFLVLLGRDVLDEWASMLLGLQHGMDTVSGQPGCAQGLHVFVGNWPNWLLEHSGPFCHGQLGSWVRRFLRRGDAQGRPVVEDGRPEEAAAAAPPR